MCSLIDVFTHSAWRCPYTSQHPQEIHGVFHGLLLANFIALRAEQFKRACRKSPFRLSDALWDFGSVILEKRGFINLFPVSANLRFVHVGSHVRSILNCEGNSHTSRTSQNSE